ALPLQVLERRGVHLEMRPAPERRLEHLEHPRQLVLVAVAPDDAVGLREDGARWKELLRPAANRGLSRHDLRLEWRLWARWLSGGGKRRCSPASPPDYAPSSARPGTKKSSAC